MSKNKKGGAKIFLVFIYIILAITALVFGLVFYKFNGKEMFSGIYYSLTEKTQIVGQVKADRGEKQLSIKEITDPVWNEKTISPVIGKAYKIDKLSKDTRPVHVEFSYDPKNLPEKISENDLKLFKWHEEGDKKYWAEIPSKVDTSKHIVWADLSHFSILAIKAPLTSYISETEINSINKKLEELAKNPPQFTCGLFVSMNEELVTSEFHYQRTGDDNLAEMHDCRQNGSVKIENAHFNISNQKSTYLSDVLVEWQIDPSESITIDGYVKDQNGKPAENATVIATKTKYDKWEQKTTTDKKGYYSMKVHSGDYSVRAISNESGCSVGETNQQFCYRGPLREEPSNNNHWQKDFKLKCSEYEIISAKPTTLYLNYKGSDGSFTLEGQSEEYTIKSEHVSKEDNGFGWEGAWKMNADIKDKMSLKDDKIYAKDGYAALPNFRAEYGGLYSFNFNIPSKPAVGTPIALKGMLSSGGYMEYKSDSGTYTLAGDGKSFSFVGDADSGSDKAVKSIDLKCKFSEADETGATIECDPEKQFYEKQGAIFKIQRKK